MSSISQSSSRPLALDLFCCAGGAARGLHDAGYDIVGVDIEDQPRYPYRFIKGDAFDWLLRDLSAFDLIWASPKCQSHSVCTPVAARSSHAVQLPDVLSALRGQSVPFIVENVSGAQRYMQSPVMLCGSMFGLGVYRHRWFELGNTDAFFLTPPCNHSVPAVLVSGTTRRLENGRRREHSKAEKTAAIGIDWMVLSELDQAIPPAYAAFLASHISVGVL